MTLPAPLRAVIRDRLAGTPLALMLDVDGTLAPIAPRPEDACVDAATRRTLERLAETEGTHVVLVSGRGAEDARAIVGVHGTWVIGNHGCERLTPAGELQVAPDVEPFLGSVAAAAVALEPVVAPVAGAFVENKIRTLSVHYRLAQDSAVPGLRERVATVARDGGLRVVEGKCVLELRPPVPIDKGTAALALARELGADTPVASVLYAGDDLTDEDAFRCLRAALPRVVTVRVATNPHAATAAELVVPDPFAVAELLAAIAAHRGAR